MLIVAGGGGAPAADRVREHRQPAAGPRCGARAGIRGAARARCEPAPPVRPDDSRGPDPLGAGRRSPRCRWPAAGLGLSRTPIPAPLVRFIPGFEFLQIDLRLMAMTAVLGALATLLFSLVPALHRRARRLPTACARAAAASPPVAGRRWLRSALAAAQVALTLALLFGSGLVLSAADRAGQRCDGLRQANVLVAQLVLARAALRGSETRRQFIDQRARRHARRFRPCPPPRDQQPAGTAFCEHGRGSSGRKAQDLRESEAGSVDFRRASEGISPRCAFRF